MNKNRLRELLRDILRNTRLAAGADVGAGNRERHFLGQDSSLHIQWEGEPAVDLRPDPAEDLGPSFYIADEGYDAFEDYVEELNKDAIIGGKVSRKAINQALGTLLGIYRENQDVSDEDLNLAIRQHLQSLRALVKDWRSFVPVDCLVLSGISELRVGRVTFRPNSAAFLEESVGRLNAITDTAPMPEPAIQQQKQLNQELVRSLFGSAPTYAEVAARAEEGRLPLLVDAEVDASLNLFRCFTHVLFPREFRAQIGLRGDVVRVMRPCLSFAEEAGSSLNGQSIGNLQPYALTPQRLEALKRDFAFEVLSEALGKQDAERNGLERVVITAMRWLGRSIVATAPPEKVLNLAAATERLLLTDNDDKAETGDKQARRMAFLIGRNQPERQAIYKQAKRYYGLRSEVIHAGRTDISEQDVNEMESLMVRSLVAMAKHLSEWQSHDDLMRWEQAATFGSPE